MRNILFGVSLIAVLGLSACGDETDSRVSDADVVCLKTIQAGGTCGTTSTATTTTVTSTATATDTVTLTSTVTSTY